MSVAQSLQAKEFLRTMNKYGYANILLVPRKLVKPHTPHIYTTNKPDDEMEFRFSSIDKFISSLVLARTLNNPLLTAFSHIPNRNQLLTKSIIFENLGLMAAFITRDELPRLLDIDAHLEEVLVLPELELINPEESAALAGAPTGVSWGIRRMRVDALWDMGITGLGITVGHLDTGMDGSHKALVDAVDSFAEVGIDGILRTGVTTRDSGSHGTHTAGLICGRKFDDLSFGCAPDSKLASAMVIEGGNVALRVIRGLDWCLSKNIKIVNLSVGVRGYNTAFQSIMRILREKNVLPIVAVGNEGPNSSRSPGNYSESLSVGAVDQNDKLWTMSSFQSFERDVDPLVPDLVAPGALVWSSWPNQGMMCLSGTSMAGPHISGLAALLLQSKPDATAYEIETAILKSASAPGSELSTTTTRGLPDAIKALSILKTGL